MLVPAVLAFMLVPDWRRRWLTSPYPWLAALIAVVVFLPVLIWNAEHDWASFRFQFVRAIATHELSLRTVGDFIGLQFGLVGFVLLPVVLSGVALTAWRGYRRREPVAILLSTCVIVPFGYFFWKSLTLAGRRYLADVPVAGRICRRRHQHRHAVARRLAGMDGQIGRSSWANAAIVIGIAFVVLVFLYYVVSPWNFIGQDRSDRRRGGLSSRSRIARRPNCRRPARPGSRPRITAPTRCCAGISTAACR